MRENIKRVLKIRPTCELMFTWAGPGFVNPRNTRSRIDRSHWSSSVRAHAYHLFRTPFDIEMFFFSSDPIICAISSLPWISSYKRIMRFLIVVYYILLCMIAIYTPTHSRKRKIHGYGKILLVNNAIWNADRDVITVDTFCIECCINSFRWKEITEHSIRMNLKMILYQNK